ncbi:MAG TPA: membrane protein insertase YidC, partial [Lysobacter sp.]|nr:membrane protein insertase YidC [Lysobacter sp.]
MNQTRLFLIFAWLMVATLLWMEWNKEQAAPPPTSTGVSTTAPAVPGSDLPDAAEQARAGVPGAPVMTAAPVAAAGLAAVAGESAAGNDAVTVTTDVLQVLLDGGEVRQADLLRYPSTAEEGSAPVRLFSREPADFFVAQSGWISNTNATPTHLSGFVLDRSAAPAGADFKLAPGQDEVVVPFVWTGPDGVSIHRTYTFRRGSHDRRAGDA